MMSSSQHVQLDDELQALIHEQFPVAVSPTVRPKVHQLCLRLYLIRCLYPYVAPLQGSFPARTPGNGFSKVILTVGTAFKPALGELYKKHPVSTKICRFEIQNRNFFLGRGTAPYPDPSPVPTPTPLGASILAPTALELGASSPHLLILEPNCFVPTLLFFRKRSLHLSVVHSCCVK